MKKQFILRAAVLTALSGLCAATALAQQDPDIADMYRQLLLLVWVPLLSTLAAGVAVKTALLRRVWAQDLKRAMVFSGLATTVEFALTLALMRVLYSPMRYLRFSFTPLVGDFASAALTGFFATLVVFLVVWRLYIMALRRFVSAPVLPESPTPSSLPAWVPPLARNWRWDGSHMAGVMAALHPVLLHLFTYAVFALFFMGR